MGKTIKMRTKIGLVLLLGLVSLSFGQNNYTETIANTQKSKVETFTFHWDKSDINGKIYLPASFSKNKNLHAIYLIDFPEEGNLPLATDEFEKVISATEQIQNFDAVVVTLEEHPEVYSRFRDFQKYIDMFKNMTSYVDTNYTNNNSRTFIARGSEGGIVLMALFLGNSETSVFENFVVTDSPPEYNSYIIKMINRNSISKKKQKNKLHFSFSTSNNRSSCTDLINSINQAQFPWLRFESLEYTEFEFENAYPIAFFEGLRYISKDIQTGLEENVSVVPKEYQLEQNYPNPFNPSTTISYFIPSVESGFSLNKVQLKIYDLLGQEVTTLVDEVKSGGTYEVKFDAYDLTTGIYFYTLRGGNFVETKKMILMR